MKENEQQFRDLANSIANLAWMAEPDGWIYWYNDPWYAYTGTVPEDMQGWGWERVHDPEVLPLVKERWSRSIAAAEPFEMVFPLRSASGEFRRFLTRVNPVRDSEGRVIRWFGTNTDVENERRAAEVHELLRARERQAREEAEHQKRMLYSLFMQAPTLIAVLRGPRHIVELANPPVAEAWGFPPEELRNRPLVEVLPELRAQGFADMLDEVYRTGVPCAGRETRAELNRPDGGVKTFYFNFLYSPFRNVQGDIEGIFVIADDVTHQVVARQEMNRLREEAESANRAKDEFIAMLGHELRNPLSPILTALQLMNIRGSDGTERERTVIERQLGHLTRLVDDLLDVSRIARGKVELKMEIVEACEVVTKAIELASPIIEQRRHTLSVDVPDEGLTVNGDPTRLSQVVSNLLTNAAKYTPPGGRITVNARHEEGDVVLRVRDTGVGIAPGMLPRIFELFVQEGQAVDRSQGGLGIGLTIVRNLIQHHGGSVAALSDGLGKGSEFIVRLPIAVEARESSDEGPAAAMPSTEGGAPSPRILVVDDNVDAAQMLAEVLGQKGYETRTAYDPPAALRIASDFMPDVALLDIGLPVMDGYELAAHLRALPGLGGVKLIALTGYGQASDRQRTRDAGFHHHLVKPVDLDALEAAVAD